MTSVGSVEVSVKLALDQLQRDASRASQELQQQFKDIDVEVALRTDQAGKSLASLQQDVLRAKAALSQDRGEAAALQKDAALFQELIRYKQQLAEIDTHLTDPEDIARAKALAAELNHLNLDKIEREFKQAGEAAENATHKVGGFNEILQGIGQGLGQQALSVAVDSLRSAGRAITDGIDRAADASEAFSAAGAAVKTLGVDSEPVAEAMRQLSDDLEGQASATNLLESAYDVLSARTATLTAGLSDAEVATKILDAATRGAVGGFSDTNTVADALTSVLNAYGQSANEAAALTDKFAATQNAGKITIDQYAQQIGKVAPLAAQAGISIDELNGFIATATVSGVQVESTFSGVRQAIAAVLKPSSEASDLAEKLGISFDAATLRTKGLAGILGELNAKGLDTPEILTKLFGSVEAVAAIAPSTGAGFKNLTANIDASVNSAGTAQKAFKDVAEDARGRLNAALNSASNSLIKLGDTILPVKTALTEIFSGVLAEATKGTQALDILGAASEKLTKTLTENPEIVEKLGKALAEVADQLSGELASGIEALANGLAESPELISKFASEVKATIEFVINLSHAVLTVVDNLKFIFPVAYGIIAVQGAIKDGVIAIANAAASVGEKLASLPIVKQLLEAVDAAKELINKLTSMPAEADKARAGLAGLSEALAPKDQVPAPTTGPAKPATPAAEPAKPKTDSESIAGRYEAETAAIENSLKERQAAIAESGASEEQQRIDTLDAEQNYLNRRVALNRQKLAELKVLKESTTDPEELKKIGEEIVKTESDLADSRLQIAQNSAQRRQEVERQAIAELEKANREAQARIERSQNAQTVGVRQQELAQTQAIDPNLPARKQAQERERIEREAEAQILAIQQSSLNQQVAQVQEQLGKIAELKQQGRISDEEATKRQLDLQQQLGGLNLQRVEAQIQAENQARQAIEEQKKIKIEAINEALDAEKVAAEASAGFNQLQIDAISRQNDLLSAQKSLLDAQFGLEQQRLQFALEDAEQKGQIVEPERLRREIIEQQIEAQRQQYALEKEQLKLKKEQLGLEIKQKQLQAEVAIAEAEVALKTAQINGADAETISNLQEILKLRQAQRGAIDEEAKARQRALDLEGRALDAQNQKAAEELARKNEKERDDPFAAAGSGGSNSGSGGGSGGSSSSGGGASGGGIGIGAVGSTDVGQLEAARQTVGVGSGSSTGELVRRSLLDGGSNRFIDQVLASQGREDVLKLAELSRAGGLQGQSQADAIAKAIDAGQLSSKEAVAKLDQLIAAVQQGLGRPNLTVNPQDAGLAGRIWADLGRSDARLANL